MATLPTMLALPRMLRHLPTTGEGLPPDEAVALDAPDAALGAALTAVRAGDWRPAATLLAGTRERAAWGRRWPYVAALADCALHRPGWLEEWIRENPEDPDAALVRAQLAIGQAWEIRTAALARDVSGDQFRAFHTLLSDAVPVLKRAAELNPGDPAPWRVAISHAMGLGAPREVFDEYLALGRACDPYDLALHERAVQYLAEKWYGSHTEMFAFAEDSAASAPGGSLLKGLPLLAVTEYAMERKAGDRKGPIAWSRIEAIVEDGLALSAAYPPGDPDAAGFRNHLALALIRCDRTADALETFRLIGVHARSFPWSYLGEPREAFLAMRKGVRSEIARSTPYFRGAVAPPSAAVAEYTAGLREAIAARGIAVCLASLPTVKEAVLLTGTTLRLATAPGRRTFVEAAPSADAGSGRTGARKLLLGEGNMVRLATVFSTATQWPVAVATRTGEGYTLTLVRGGREVTAHTWHDAASVPSQAEAAAVAEALAEAFGVADPRPVAAVLRACEDPRRHLDEAFAALGLPKLPDGFGTRSEALAGLPGALLVERRSFFGGIKEIWTADSSRSGGELPPLQ